MYFLSECNRETDKVSICISCLSVIEKQIRWVYVFLVLRFKYTTKFSLPKIACPAIVYAEIVVVIDPFFVGACP